MRYELCVMRKNNLGFSLIEVLVSSVIIAILTLSIFNLIIYSLKVTGDNKLRMAAATIANQKMEYVRSLPYNNVGTTSGIPFGIIPVNETVNVNNGVFFVNTLVEYEDDPFDGIEDGMPDDLLPTDYKEVRIRVSWNGPFGFKNVSVFTKIAPRGMETNAGGGTLSILVFDASGMPVATSSAHIENNLLNPAINFDIETNSDGKISLPGAPESIEGYEITVTKAGYSTSSTTARTVDNPNPTKPHATVLEGEKTEISFAIDLLSDLNIYAVAANLPQNWQVNTDETGENQINSRLVIDSSGYIYIVWQDYRDSSSSRIYAQKYDSGGNAQWLPDDIKISDANKQVLPDIMVDSAGDLYICWNDDSPGNEEVYLDKRNSADGSDAWIGAERVDTLADAKDQTNGRMSLSEILSVPEITVVWQDNRNTDLDIFMQRYDAARNELWIPEISVNANPADGTNQYEPEITADSADNLYVAWTDSRNGDLNIYGAKHDTIGSALWAADLLINTDGGATDQYSPDIAIDSADNAYIVWTDERNGNPDIYAQKYDADGNVLWASDLLINTNADLTSQYSPAIAIDSLDNIYIVWTDERNGNPDIYAQKYDADGNNLWSEDVRLNIDLGTSAQYNPDVTINPVNNVPYASWEDDREDDFDIYATPFDNYGTETPIANAPINIQGAKKIGEDPVIYKYSQNFSTNGSGIISISNIEWDSYTLTLPDGYSAYAIIMSEPLQPTDLPPDSVVEVKLYLK
ncbi:prepilin-type N-terminal cleavage/methylation domain-containing protein [Candidatus Falkowbacteria bacterium]|nr:prepilin-type N-terminal cleavage/methylation domain-containing protein [Candidatus Falkowbacteria bacterium]